jgi:DNA-binding transcriptional regulator YdaS (Cro superfamily)
MNKSKAIELAGGVKALARLLGITSAAVSQWSDVVPEARIWQLRVLRPEWFA